MLEVPLQARRLPQDGIEQIQVYCNGESSIVPAPVRPYFYSRKGINLDCDDFKEEQVRITPISTLEEINAWKYSFPEVAYISKFNHVTKNSEEEKKFVMENHLGFLERVAIDEPDFFNQWREELNCHIIFDIETASERFIFSHVIIAIALKLVNLGQVEETICWTGDERDILKEFADFWKSTDPDVIVTYNGKYFDLPVIIERCKYHNISLDFMQRGTDKPPRQDDAGRVHRLDGRVMFDVWEQVDTDQSLFGIKNRRLKTVAKWFGQEVIEEELFSTVDLLDDVPRLRAYCKSDVDLTYFLYNIYQHSLIQVANILKFPYDQIVNPGGGKGKAKSRAGRAREGSSTLINRIISGRGMHKRGFCEDGQNRQKYPELYHQEGLNFQGALVEINQTGVFDSLYHVDFSSMYPSAQTSVNISPETTKLISLEPYNIDAPLIKERGEKYTIFEIPDNRLQGEGRNAIIYVDQSFEGEVPRILRELKQLRTSIKIQEKEAKKKGDTNLTLQYKSQQNGIKVTMNATGFGSQSPAVVRYGSVICAILITGIGRYMITLSKKFIEEYNG